MLHIPARYQTVAAILLAFVTGSVEAGDTMIFVVRHAEKKQDIDQYLRMPPEYLRLPDHVKDAHIPLRSEGIQLAIDLRDLFRPAGIKLDAVYATRFLRTWQTGAPSAKAAGVEVTAPEFNAQLIARLRSGDLGKNILIVGHSGSRRLSGSYPGRSCRGLAMSTTTYLKSRFRTDKRRSPIADMVARFESWSSKSRHLISD